MSANLHVWNPLQYHENSSAQNNAATCLLQHLSLQGDEQILDVGCGDGKLTEKISSLLANGGTILGMDISAEMIDFAQSKYPKESYQNLRFVVQDAQKLDYDDRFDVIFSSFALQWAKDVSAFFKGAGKALKSSGVLALTIPLGISDSLEQSIKKVTAKPCWESYFKGFSPGWHFQSPSAYEGLLKDHDFSAQLFDVVQQQQQFPSRESLENYIRPWFSYLRVLPKELQSTFFKEVMNNYFELAPALPDGKTYLRFERVDIVATKKSSNP